MGNYPGLSLLHRLPTKRRGVRLTWTFPQPRKLRQHLDGLLTSTKDMPNRMRQYSAFEYVQDVLRSHLKSNSIISELKSDALKERHWRQLFKVLRVSAETNLSR